MLLCQAASEASLFISSLDPLHPLGRIAPGLAEDDALVGPHRRLVALAGDIADEPFRLGEAAVAQADHRPLRPRVHLVDIGGAAEALQGHDLEQILHLRRQGAEAVDHLGGEGIDLLLVHQRGDAPVEGEAHRQVGDIGLRYQHRHAEADLRRPGIGGCCLSLAAGLGHRVFQHLLVELDANLADMAGLLVAQQIAGAADIQIVAGQGEAGAELVQRLRSPRAAASEVGEQLALRRASLR